MRGYGTVLLAALLTLNIAQTVFADVPADSAGTTSNHDGPIDGCASGSESKSIWARLSDSYKSHLAWDGSNPKACAFVLARV